MPNMNVFLARTILQCIAVSYWSYCYWCITSVSYVAIKSEARFQFGFKKYQNQNSKDTTSLLRILGVFS